MAKELKNCSNEGGVKGKIRQRPDFREAKHAYRRLNKEHVVKVPDKEISQSIQHNKEGKILNNNLMNMRSTPFRFTLELDGHIILQQVRLHPRSGSRTMNGSRVKVGIIGDLQPGLNSNNFKVEIICTGKPVAQLNTTHQEVIPTEFSHCSGSCLSLAGNFQIPGNRRSV